MGAEEEEEEEEEEDRTRVTRLQDVSEREQEVLESTGKVCKSVLRRGMKMGGQGQREEERNGWDGLACSCACCAGGGGGVNMSQG